VARTAVEIELSPEARATLDEIVRSRMSSVRLVERARIVLMAADGMENKAIARRLKVDPQRVGRWRRRYAESGLAGIERDRPGRGRKAETAQRETPRILNATLHAKPPGGATHWSTRTLGRHLGVSRELVRRVWNAHNLEPHRCETFKLSTDPRFVDKLVDVVGLYLDPPENAVVFSADEKSQCQALERMQQRRMDQPRLSPPRNHDALRRALRRYRTARP
jgi:transposase